MMKKTHDKCQACKMRKATELHKCPFSEKLQTHDHCNCCRRCEIECKDEADHMDKKD